MAELVDAADYNLYSDMSDLEVRILSGALKIKTPEGNSELKWIIKRISTIIMSESYMQRVEISSISGIWVNAMKSTTSVK